MSKKKIVAIVLFLLVGLTTFTFAGQGLGNNPVNIGGDEPENNLLQDPATGGGAELGEEDDEIVQDNNVVINPNPNVNLDDEENDENENNGNNENPNLDDEEEDIPYANPIINVSKEITTNDPKSFNLTDGVEILLDPRDTTTTSADVQISAFDRNKLGIQEVVYSITDQFGNTASFTRNITVIDDEAPKIETPNGVVKKLAINSDFELIKVNVTDNFDTNLTVDYDVTTVNTGLYGEYSLVLTATDSSGNTSLPVTITYKIVNDITKGYTDIFAISGTLDNNEFDLGDKKSVITDNNNLKVTATLNNGKVIDLDYDDIQIKSFGTNINNANKGVDKKNFVIKLLDDKTITDKVTYYVYRSYSVKFLMPTTVDGLSLPATVNTLISETTLRYGSEITAPSIPNELDAITIDDRNYIKFTGEWDKEVNIVTGDMEFTAIYKSYVRNYHAKVYVSLDGEETLLEDCAMKYGDVIADKCAALSSPVGDYEGFKFDGYTVNGVSSLDITSEVLLGDAKIVAVYSRIDNDTNLRLTLTDKYEEIREGFLFDIVTMSITPSSADKQLLVFDVISGTGFLPSDIQVTYVGEDTPTSYDVKFQMGYDLNTVYYIEVDKSKTIEKIEYKFIGDLEFKVKTAKYSFDGDRFYSYGE